MNIFNILRVLEKKLPKIIQIPLRCLYDKYITMVVLDERLVLNIQKYFNLDREETLWLMKFGERLNVNLWKIVNPATETEKNAFYSNTHFYVFGLAWWHATRFQRGFRVKIAQFAKGNILDYGGGIGDFCVALKENGFTVEYADVAGKTFDFAAWLFSERGFKIPIINLSSDVIVK